MPTWMLKPLILLVIVAGFLAGVIGLGQWALSYLRHHERYAVRFSDIECTPPPGLDRVVFLDEVQYCAGLPQVFRLLDDDLATRLTEGFRRHPWVARVVSVELVPPRQVRVELVYRRPVLAVRDGKTLRAVDGEGVLLPKDAATDGLPVYPGKAARPAGPAGAHWGDPAVEKMAHVIESQS